MLKLAIVGGGAAGMFAAWTAAARGMPCVLIERKARLGSKVLMTANGRCNFTKDITADTFLKDVGVCASFVERAVRELPPRKIIETMKSLRLPVRRISEFRMFPADGKAASVVHAFGDYFRDHEVPIITNCAVRGVALNPQKRGFTIATNNFTFEAENVLIATGGVSYPKLGSVGDGQNFARNLGHRVVPFRPGLIGLETADPRVTRNAGARFEDGFAQVSAPGGKALFSYRGEIDCESFGLSGAAIYNAERFIEHSRRDGRLKDYRLEVSFGKNRMSFENLSPRPLKEAIVTIGGVATDEVNPATMESKIVPGLYFAGEVLDIDGPTGGYNLTLAFATAHRAVMSLCRERERRKPFAKNRESHHE